MKNSKIGFGVLLIGLGVIWTLTSFNMLNWSMWSVFEALRRLWPLILVVIGINVIFREYSVVKAITWLAFFGVLIGYGFIFDTGTHKGITRSEVTRTGTERQISVDNKAEIKSGELRLGLGGLRMDIASGTDKLADASTTVPEIKHNVDYRDNGEKAVVRFDLNEHFVIPSVSSDRYFNLNLNKDILWDMNLKVGASEGNLNLSDLKVKDIDIDIGAGKLDIDLGNLNKSTTVKVNGGVSRIDINVPKESGVKVKMQGALSGTNLKDLGWTKIGSSYISPNYDSAENKVDVEVNMGVGEFNVNTK